MTGEPRPDPDVILDVVFEEGLLFIAVRNLGTRPAVDVSCAFDKAFRALVKQLFPDGTDQAPLKLVDSKTFSTGVIYAIYEPAAE